MGSLECGVPGGGREASCSGISTDKAEKSPTLPAPDLTSTPRFRRVGNLTCRPLLLPSQVVSTSPRPASPWSRCIFVPSPRPAGLALQVPVPTRVNGAAGRAQTTTQGLPACVLGGNGARTQGTDRLQGILLPEQDAISLLLLNRLVCLSTDYPAGLQRDKNLLGRPVWSLYFHSENRERGCQVFSGLGVCRASSRASTPGPAMLHPRTPARGYGSLRSLPDRQGPWGASGVPAGPPPFLLISSLQDSFPNQCLAYK